MKHCFALSLFFMLAVTISPVSVAVAQDDDSAASNDTSSDGIGDEIGGIIEAAGGISDAKKSGDKKGVWILVLTIVSLIIKLLVDLAGGPLLPKGKTLKWVAVILGCVAGGLSILISGLQGQVAGVPALLMFLSGPLAIALHELGKEVPVLAQISNVLASIGHKD